MRKRKYFCLIATSGNVYKVLHMFYIQRRQKFATRALLCNTYCLCTADSIMLLKNTKRMRFSLSPATMVTRR